MLLKGKALKYGDDVNTDLIIAGKYTKTNSLEEHARHCMEDLDPDSLVAMIESFATTLVDLRDKLDAAQPQAGEDGGAAELEETLSQFIRV